uniref:Amidase domain-containing protein n=1 Tax=Oryza glumipatula TaxID=40148 RepID=A0A0D9Y2F7_9ORYZ
MGSTDLGCSGDESWDVGFLLELRRSTLSDFHQSSSLVPEKEKHIKLILPRVCSKILCFHRSFSTADPGARHGRRRRRCGGASALSARPQGKITRLNALLHAVIEIEVNSDALQQPARADTEHASGHSYCGPLHGVHILKDNIVKRDRLNTTAGSFALLGSVVCRDAGVTAGLRAAAAAAIILSKANPSEWPNFQPRRSFASTRSCSMDMIYLQDMIALGGDEVSVSNMQIHVIIHQNCPLAISILYPISKVACKLCPLDHGSNTSLQAHYLVVKVGNTSKGLF